MDEQKQSDFKMLFSDYCKSQMNAGTCEPDGCEFCCINAAYNKIFGADDDQAALHEEE